jgi:hypothetical protein
LAFCLRVQPSAVLPGTRLHPGGDLSEDVSRVDVLFVGGAGLGVLAGGLRAGLWVRLGEQSGFGLDQDAAALRGGIIDASYDPMPQLRDEIQAGYPGLVIHQVEARVPGRYQQAVGGRAVRLASGAAAARAAIRAGRAGRERSPATGSPFCCQPGSRRPDRLARYRPRPV